MKGIVIAGGFGTRLHPTTMAVSKHLLLVYDKPMVYYPIATLISADIHEIVIISFPRDLENYRKLLGTGSQWGLQFHYVGEEAFQGIGKAILMSKTNHFRNISNKS